MMFNCVALSITLLAMVLSRKGPTFGYTYGYDRHEVVAAFSNSMFLLFVRRPPAQRPHPPRARWLQPQTSHTVVMILWVAPR